MFSLPGVSLLRFDVSLTGVMGVTGVVGVDCDVGKKGEVGDALTIFDNDDIEKGGEIFCSKDGDNC